jgi:hypothetical protein
MVDDKQSIVIMHSCVDKFGRLIPIVEKLPNYTRFVCVSNTYNKLPLMHIPPGDVFIHAGNFSLTGSINEVAGFNDHMESLPHKMKLFTIGDNDKHFKKISRFGFHHLTNGIYLESASTIINGIRIHGFSEPSAEKPIPPCEILFAHVLQPQITNTKVHIYGNYPTNNTTTVNGIHFMSASSANSDLQLVNYPIVFDFKNQCKGSPPSRKNSDLS